MGHVGFIGLGQMGGPMSRNLMKGGYRLKVFDVDRAAVDRLVKEGAQPSRSPKDAAVGADMLFTIFPIGSIVEDVLFGKDGAVESLSKEALYVDMSTILPDDTDRIGRRLEAKGIAWVNAPVGRTSAAAVEGKSLFMVGGSAENVARVRPYLEKMGDTVIHCGKAGTGSRMKIVNNYMSVVLNLVTAETLTLAETLGVARDVALAVMRATPAGRGHMNTTWITKALKDDPAPDFMLDLAFKDLGLALETAGAKNVPLATGAAARQIYALARGQGYGRNDWTTAIYWTVRRLSGL